MSSRLFPARCLPLPPFFPPVQFPHFCNDPPAPPPTQLVILFLLLGSHFSFLAFCFSFSVFRFLFFVFCFLFFIFFPSHSNSFLFVSRKQMASPIMLSSFYIINVPICSHIRASFDPQERISCGQAACSPKGAAWKRSHIPAGHSIFPIQFHLLKRRLSLKGLPMVMLQPTRHLPDQSFQHNFGTLVKYRYVSILLARSSHPNSSFFLLPSSFSLITCSLIA
jgi:hypothetical protein